MLQVDHLSTHSDQSITHSSPYFYALSPALTWAEGRVTPWTCWSVHHRATLTDKDRQPFTLTHTAHLKLPICLACVLFLDCVKREPTQTQGKPHTERPQNPWSSYFVCDSTNHCTTMDVWNRVTSQQYNVAGLQLFKPIAQIFLNPLAGATCRNHLSNLIGLTNS